MNNQKNLKTAMMFADHMVLQREKPVPVWGTGEDGKKVEVRFRGNSCETIISEGKWCVWLPAMDAGKGDAMQIICEDESIHIQDVKVGEVWLAGGQSNMEFYLRYDEEYRKGLDKGENDDIVFFDYPEVSYPEQLEENDYSNFGFWRPCTKENLDYYSAVAYYFANKLQKQYQVPVGIVGCNWGGTTASCWMSEDYLRGNEGEVWLEEYEEAVKSLDIEEYEKAFLVNPSSYSGQPFANAGNEALLYGIQREQMLALIPEIEKMKDSVMPPVGPKSPWRPCGVYESMLKKVAPYGIRGVIWYQGESDDIHADVYETVLSQMIRCWRDLWGEEIPFLITQIAPLAFWFSGTPDAYPLIREKQELVAEHVPNVWMTTIGDAGMEWDVHPKKKRPVGERLALLAMGHIYGEAILCDPPKCTEMIVEDEKVILKFANAEAGLIQNGETISALECNRYGQPMEDYTAIAEGEAITISSETIKAGDEIDIKFAMAPYHEVNVYNRLGIPIRPFHMESSKL